MALRHGVWDEIKRMRRELNRLLKEASFFDRKGEDFFPRAEELDLRDYRSALFDIKEEQDHYLVTAEIPGVEKKDIELNITDNGLEIKAEKKDETREESDRGYSYSRSYKGFYQFIEMPENANLDDVEAEYKNGVLIIRVAKKKSSVDKKSIEIK